jgi:hypothetical protein
MNGAGTHIVRLASEAMTAELGRILSLWARPGFVIALSGELGAGKSVLARGFIHALLKGDGDIPSPSFSLVQDYGEARVPVFHADLYRLKERSEIEELGLGDLLRDHCGIIEWVERLDSPLSPDTLLIHLTGSGTERKAHLTATGGWLAALARNDTIAAFLGQPPFGPADRNFFEGDASARRYETIRLKSGEALLMDMPQRPDGPPVKDGKPYSQIAHLAEGISAVIAVNAELHRLGYSVPETLRADPDRGLALIEILHGDVYGHMAQAGRDMREPLTCAAAVLADMAVRDWPDTVLAGERHAHQVMPYDAEALLIEADLLPSWFVPHLRGRPADPAMVSTFTAIWQRLMPLTEPRNPVWTLRDYHSPNLIWMPQRDGLRRVGIIDTQDAVMGHPAYDLASLCQDARVDVPDALHDLVVEHYCDLREQQGGFDRDGFLASYAVLGAQRATKILGIFARLSKRDGKHGYLRHMPRVSRHLARNLLHPALAELKDWYEGHLPEALAMVS